MFNPEIDAWTAFALIVSFLWGVFFVKATIDVETALRESRELDHKLREEKWKRERRNRS